MKYLNHTLALLVSIALFVSCGSNQKKEQSSDTFSIEDYIKAAETIDLGYEEGVRRVADLKESIQLAAM